MYNILILDPGFIGKNVILDVLVKNGFNVHVAANEIEASLDLERFGPHLVICRASARLISEERHLCDFQNAVAMKGIPFVVISSGVGADFYLRALDRGVSHAIIAPFSANSLVARIRDILTRGRIDAPEGPVAIRCRYRGSEYSINASPAQLTGFILSLLDDTLAHSSALGILMKRKDLLHRNICGADVFNESRLKTDKEEQLERELFLALERGEFRLHYQPIISLKEDRLSGFEALVRWEHPSRGLVAPSEFIPFAERTPLIIPIGFKIIEEATRQLQSWCDTISIGDSIHVSINLSANQFVHPELSSRIRRSISDHRLVPETVGFEITESAIMNDMESANIQLLNLKADGHPIYMDDFGTGYSSLSYLQHFPVDALKIDRSFVRWMHMDEQSEHIVRSVVGLAHNLKMRVVAEGIEEDSHMRLLKELECDFGQGMLISRPLDADESRDYLLGSYRRKRA